MKTISILLFLALVSTAWAAEGKAKGKAGGAGRPAVVAHERLQDFLPKLPGWKRGDVQGETVTRGLRIARLQVDYEKGESGLSFEIMDTLGDKNLLEELRSLIKPGYAEKRNDGYTKATTIKSWPAVEEWTNEVRNGFISVLVAERFVVKVTGSTLDKVETMRAAIEAVDLDRLAGMK